jgi:hypothetical protein
MKKTKYHPKFTAAGGSSHPISLFLFFVKLGEGCFAGKVKQIKNLFYTTNLY